MYIGRGTTGAMGALAPARSFAATGELPPFKTDVCTEFYHLEEGHILLY